jgi:hypothetical protein
MQDVSLVGGYALVMWGGVVLMLAYGLTGMVSRYAKRTGADRRFTAFDIHLWCVVLAVFAILWLVAASYV